MESDWLYCKGAFSLQDLLNYRQHGGTQITCLKCCTNHNIAELLTGFSQPDQPVRLALEKLNDQLASVSTGVGRLEAYAAASADSMRRVLAAVTSEVNDCPRLFTLTPAKATGTRRLRLEQRHYRLTLWCEHPGHWHPWPEATYLIDQPREWLVRVAPYLNLIFNILKLVLPVAIPATGIVLKKEQLQNAESELRLMTALIADVPQLKLEDQGSFVDRESATAQLTPAQGQALREARLLIFDRDRARKFGGLRRVQAPSAEFLWVCPDHYTEYDPGLPRIPALEVRRAPNQLNS